MKNLQANLITVESTVKDIYSGDTAGESIIATASGSASKGETAQQYGQPGLIGNPTQGTIGLRVRKGSLDIIVASNLYSVPLPENQGETLLYSTDADGVVTGKHYLDNDGIHTFNDGADFAVRYSALETAYNQLQSEVDQLITDINTLKGHTHPVQVTPATGTGATTGILPVIPVQPPSTGDITPSKVEEILIP